MGKNTEETSGNEQEIVLSSDDAQKVKELEKELEEKNSKIKNLEKQGKGKNSDDIAPGIRKTYEFTGNYRNAYEDGKYKKAKETAKKEKEAKMLANK